MGKRFGAGRCVHCGEHVAELTGDHVLPEAWYPDSTPSDLEKWQAPSCYPCNSDLGKFERNLFQKLALGVDPWVPGGEGVGDRAIRRFDARAAKSGKDRMHRQAGAEKVRRMLRDVESIPIGEAIFPNVGTIPPPTNERYTIQDLDWSEIERLVTKFVRGMTFVATGAVLPQEYVVHVINPAVYGRMPEELLNMPAELFERGSGFRVLRHQSSDDRFAALFRIFLWGKYEFFAAVWHSRVERSRDAG